MKADESKAGKKIVAIASSTGGPKALQTLIPLLPSNLYDCTAYAGRVYGSACGKAQYAKPACGQRSC